jgi:hypothetical protein
MPEIMNLPLDSEPWDSESVWDDQTELTLNKNHRPRLACISDTFLNPWDANICHDLSSLYTISKHRKRLSELALYPIKKFKNASRTKATIADEAKPSGLTQNEKERGFLIREMRLPRMPSG